MFADVKIKRGFSEITFDMDGPTAGDTRVIQTPFLPMAGVKLHMSLPEAEIDEDDPLAPFLGLKLVLNPAVLFVLSMHKAASFIEVEHDQFPHMSRTTPIHLSMGGDRMMEIMPRQEPDGRWAVKMELFSGPDNPSDFVDWEAKDWTWVQMIALALCFPAFTLIKMMGLVDDFREQMTAAEADIALTNEVLAPDWPPVTTKMQGFNISGIGGQDTDVSTPADSAETKIVADTEDEFDRAFKKLVSDNKKGELSA